MNQIPITDLPDILFDAQRADACLHRYQQQEYVFTAEKWRDLIGQAYESGKLPVLKGAVDTSRVNQWLAEADLDLWSLFQLHKPISPDLTGQFGKKFSELDQVIQERIKDAEPTLLIKWDRITPDERQRQIDDADSIASPRTRLFFAIGDIVLWGGHLNPPEQTLLEAAKKQAEAWESLQPDKPSEKQLLDTKQAEIAEIIRRIEAIHDQILSGRFDEADVTTEMINVLAENKGAAWCSNVPFPVWLAQTSSENLQPVQNQDQTSKEKTVSTKSKRDKQRRQETAIVDTVKKLGYDPKSLPKAKNGHKGVRSEVLELLIANSELFGTKKTAEIAWERTKAFGDIKDANEPSPLN